MSVVYILYRCHSCLWSKTIKIKPGVNIPATQKCENFDCEKGRLVLVKKE